MSNSNHDIVTDRRQQFAAWRAGRPFLAGVLVLLGSAFMFYVTAFQLSLILIGNMSVLVAFVTSSFVFLAGVFALMKPEHSTMIGYAGVALSIISILGTLGGLFVGMLLGIIGSCLCIAWEPDGDAPFDWESDSDADESDDTGVSGLIEKWR